MDSTRVDLLSRNLASRASRRGVVKGASAGGIAGFLAVLFGRGVAQPAAAQALDEPVQCTWWIEAQGSAGPNRHHVWNGVLAVTINPDGRIDDGSYTLVDPWWQPLLDSTGDPITFDVVGSTHQRSIDFRVEHDGCTQLAFTGVNRDIVSTCHGPMSGSFEGPALTDLGGWRTWRDPLVCPACEGLTCKPGEVIDWSTCTCQPVCPGGKDPCGRRICPPDACPPGTTWNDKTCDCTCEPVSCDPGFVQCPLTCTCIPDDPCQALDCPKETVAVLTADGICTCQPVCPNPDGPCTPTCDDLTCADGEVKFVVLVEGMVIDCACIPNECPPQPCPETHTWNKETCSCQPDCPPVVCATWETFDPATCSCGSTTGGCTEEPCAAPKVWDKVACACVCPPGSCPTGGPVDPNTCGCAQTGCVEQQCPGNYKWDPTACACYCPDLTCDLGYVPSTDTCSCVPCIDVVTCDQGYVLDEVKCTCYPQQPDCSTAPPCTGLGQYQDPGTCNCVCEGNLTMCNGACVDTYGNPFGDNKNCGGCGIVCSERQSCFQGVCSLL